MRAIAERLDSYAERLEGAWSVEIGSSGPVLAMRRLPKRHAGTVLRIRRQLDEQLLLTHPGRICVRGPAIEDPALGRLRLPDAVVLPEAALDEESFAVDAAQVTAVVEVVSPAGPTGDRVDKLVDYPAMGIADCMIVDPRTGTIEVHSDPCKGRYMRKDAYIYGDSVPFGPWRVETSEFRRYGRPGE